MIVVLVELGALNWGLRMSLLNSELATPTYLEALLWESGSHRGRLSVIVALACHQVGGGRASELFSRCNDLLNLPLVLRHQGGRPLCGSSLRVCLCTVHLWGA